MVTNDLSSLEIFELTIIGEARGEPIQGQVAVACVIRNRLHNHPSKYHDYRSVCLEPKQFSCWNTDDVNYSFIMDVGSKMLNNQPITDLYLKQCMWVADGVSNWDIIDNTGGSEYYMTKKLWTDSRPLWARDPKSDPLTIGSQVFFNV